MKDLDDMKQMHDPYHKPISPAERKLMADELRKRETPKEETELKEETEHKGMINQMKQVKKRWA